MISNGMRVIDLCAKSGLCASNTYFKHKSLHKYTKVVRGQAAVDVMNMTDLVLLKEDMLCYMQSVRAVRGMRRGLSDHHVLLCKVRLVGAFIKGREVVNGITII